MRGEERERERVFQKFEAKIKFDKGLTLLIGYLKPFI